MAGRKPGYHVVNDVPIVMDAARINSRLIYLCSLDQRSCLPSHIVHFHPVLGQRMSPQQALLALRVSSAGLQDAIAIRGHAVESAFVVQIVLVRTRLVADAGDASIDNATFEAFAPKVLLWLFDGLVVVRIRFVLIVHVVVVLGDNFLRRCLRCMRFFSSF